MKDLMILYVIETQFICWLASVPSARHWPFLMVEVPRFADVAHVWLFGDVLFVHLPMKQSRHFPEGTRTGLWRCQQEGWNECYVPWPDNIAMNRVSAQMVLNISWSWGIVGRTVC